MNIIMNHWQGFKHKNHHGILYDKADSKVLAARDSHLIDLEWTWEPILNKQFQVILITHYLQRYIRVGKPFSPLRYFNSGIVFYVSE